MTQLRSLTMDIESRNGIETTWLTEKLGQWETLSAPSLISTEKLFNFGEIKNLWAVHSPESRLVLIVFTFLL